MSDVPNPGSRAAIGAGCTCPVFDNRNGEGFMLRGERVFWYSETCPVHNPNKSVDVTD